MTDRFTITCNQCQIQVHTERRSFAITEHDWIYDGEQWLCDACYDTQTEAANGIQS